jgi:uncharacterized MAPEG superfamily protein
MVPAFLAIGFATYYLLAMGRFEFAVKCICTALLFTLVLSIENVSRERLFSPAIDPIDGKEAPYMKIAQRLLASSAEQFLVFAVGLLGLSQLLTNGKELRLLVALTVVWVLSRFVFWIGYSFGSKFRSAGLFGMVQSYVVLLYVVAKFAANAFGATGLVCALSAFALCEAVITFSAIKRNRRTN